MEGEGVKGGMEMDRRGGSEGREGWRWMEGEGVKGGVEMDGRGGSEGRDGDGWKGRE